VEVVLELQEFQEQEVTVIIPYFQQLHLQQEEEVEDTLLLENQEIMVDQELVVLTDQ
jgi:hypothetical protein